MKRPRPTIAGWMVLAAFVAINAALGRACRVDPYSFEIILLEVLAFQVGLAGVILGRGRGRRAWIGFEAAGVAAFLGLVAAEEFPGSACHRWFLAYHEAAVNLAFARLPEPVLEFLEDGQARLAAVIYFVPVLLAAIAGGSLAGFASRRGRSTAPVAEPAGPAPLGRPELGRG